MCVAIYIPEHVERPTLEAYQRMERGNGDGAGVGWYDPSVDKMRWRKELDAKQVFALIEAIGTDARVLAHFRMASVGGKSKGLTHPFPIGMPPTMENGEYNWGWDLEVEGLADELMIHNGHWNSWEQARPRRLPPGPWSDSRLAAYLADYNPIILNNLTGKVATLNKMRATLTGGWDQVDGVWYSNTAWRYGTGYQYSSNYQGTTHTGAANVAKTEPGPTSLFKGTHEGPKTPSAEADSWKAYRTTETAQKAVKDTEPAKDSDDFAMARARREDAQKARETEKAAKKAAKAAKHAARAQKSAERRSCWVGGKYEEPTQTELNSDTPLHNQAPTSTTIIQRVAHGGGPEGPFVVEYDSPMGYLTVFCKDQAESDKWMNMSLDDWETELLGALLDMAGGKDKVKVGLHEADEVQDALKQYTEHGGSD